LSADAQRSRQSLFPAERRISAFGLYHFCIGIAALLSSLLVGYLYQHSGAGSAFTFVTVLTALLVLLFLILFRVPFRA
jgi:MFS family permease